jgi:histidyl-tRNA synthetase
VVAVGEGGAHAAARRLVDELRDAGVPAERSYEDRPLKAQLKMADHAGAAFAAIVGERELAGGVVTLRRLADGEQETVATEELAGRLLREGS